MSEEALSQPSSQPSQPALAVVQPNPHDEILPGEPTPSPEPSPAPTADQPKGKFLDRFSDESEARQYLAAQEARAQEYAREAQRMEAALTQIAQDPVSREFLESRFGKKGQVEPQMDSEAQLEMLRLASQFKAGDLPGFIGSMKKIMAKEIIPQAQAEAQRVTRDQLVADMGPHMMKAQFLQSDKVKDIHPYVDTVMSLVTNGMDPAQAVGTVRGIVQTEASKYKEQRRQRGYMENGEEGVSQSLRNMDLNSFKKWAEKMWE